MLSTASLWFVRGVVQVMSCVALDPFYFMIKYSTHCSTPSPSFPSSHQIITTSPPRAIMSFKLIPNTTQDAGTDNSYVSRQGHKHEPVQVIADEQARDEVKNNNQTNNTSNDQLDKQAIDQSNIIFSTKPVTRGAAPPKGAYKEPTDTEGLPRNDGRSSV
ncbi:hypothetical protein QC763_607170 [Podospora pseudopauciseta]|uniref:Uncharacterized protein n=1 Tax=Podospora pseudopauciseta TaxID=2093780 RepID=A0ABR0H5Z9_9PEZI|nr:hypothetical protein QC763_607170 [Podospora pseudopauciseta]